MDWVGGVVVSGANVWPLWTGWSARPAWWLATLTSHPAWRPRRTDGTEQAVDRPYGRAVRRAEGGSNLWLSG
jgi:hypothetical protein